MATAGDVSGYIALASMLSQTCLQRPVKGTAHLKILRMSLLEMAGHPDKAL